MATQGKDECSLTTIKLSSWNIQDFTKVLSRNIRNHESLEFVAMTNYCDSMGEVIVMVILIILSLVYLIIIMTIILYIISAHPPGS